MKDASYVRPASAQPQGRRLVASGATCGEVCEVEVIHAQAVQVARAALPSDAQAQRLVELFSAFANATRLRILVALRSAVGAPRPELCVCDLAAITGASQSMVSHQLAALRELALVVARRDGRLVYYRLVDEALAGLVDNALACAPQEAP